MDNEKMSIAQLEALCHREGRKISNGERRLRELQDPTHSFYNPRIGEVKNEKGAIISYTYMPTPEILFHRKVRSGNYQPKLI